MREKPTKKANNTRDSLRDEYDFSRGERGKYARRFPDGTSFVCLDRDVAEFFPDSDSVNEALRPLVKLLRKRTERKSTKAGPKEIPR